MNLMDGNEKGKDIEKLTQILSKIQLLYYKKQEQLEDLKIELNELKDVLNHLNSLISTKSFSSADEIYFKSLADPETYFSENISKEKVKGTNIKRKIFSTVDSKETDLLCILKFIDFNRVEIKFIDPDKRQIKESSEKFITTFLKGALIRIKEENPNLNLNYGFYNESDIIETIGISNLKTIKEYDLITSKIRELLTTERSMNIDN